MILLSLFWEFFKTGLFAIGGGMATLPFLFDISTRTSWFTQSELADMIAVSESTPGPIGINAATYVGYKVSGIIGSCTAIAGLVLPSLIIISIIASLVSKYNETPVVKTVFTRLRAVVIGLLSFAIIQLGEIVFIKNSGIDLISCVFYLIVLLTALKFKKIHPLFFIAAGAFFGIFVF